MLRMGHCILTVVVVVWSDKKLDPQLTNRTTVVPISVRVYSQIKDIWLCAMSTFHWMSMLTVCSHLKIIRELCECWGNTVSLALIDKPLKRQVEEKYLSNNSYFFKNLLSNIKCVFMAVYYIINAYKEY